ncbi:MAG: carboxypeptidase regulatory-like domain-containing protein [Candidatus Acidiferrales bacterium]
MRNFRVALSAFAFLFAVMLMPTLTNAQTSNGTLVGTVTDQSGAAVPNAKVKALSPQYGQSYEATTDSAGTYRMDGLQPGTYSVTFSASGFADLQVGQVIMRGSVTTTVDGKLQLGVVNKTIVVEASAAQTIDTQSGQLGESLGKEEVENLPYIGTNPAELAQTLPGVQDIPAGGSASQGFTNGFGYSVNGTRPRANNFLIDGVDDNDYSISGQAYQPTNVGAVQEFTILTNSYSAEFGRGGGSVGNYIFKSGTNSYHGQAWEIANNSAFGTDPAQNKIAGLTKPLFIENQFGFDVGGPVVKDKLFFFASLQWDRIRQRGTGPSNEFLPTAAGVATLQSLLPNPNVQLLLSSLGGLTAPEVASGAQAGTGLFSPTCPALGGGRPCVKSGLFQLGGVPEASNDRQQYYRADWHIGPSDVLSAGYIRDDSALSPDFFANAINLPQFETLQGGPSQLFHAQWVHTISSRLVNELRASYTNINFAFAQTPKTLAGPLANIPEIDFGSDVGYPSLGVGSGFPQGRGHKTIQGQEAMSYSAGRHTLKFGADITHLTVRDEIPFNSRGDISYALGGGFSSLGNFVDDFTGQGGSVSKVFGSPLVTPSLTIYAPYVQDTWRVKNNLTLDLGLRYEYWGTVENSLKFPAINYALGFGIPGSSFPGAFAFKQQPDRKNFGPRLGIAYTPHWGQRIFGEDKTVIRAGYGVFYDGLFTNIVDNTAASAPNVTGGTVTGGAGRGAANTSALLAAITPVANPFTTVDTIANNLKSPMTQQWNFDIQRELPSKFIVTAAYVGTRGQNLYVNQDFNPTVNFGPRLNPNFGDILVRSNAGHSNYNSAQLEVERRLNTAFTVRGAYTYSKFLDTGSEVFVSTGGSSVAQDVFNQAAEYGPSAFDRRHRFNISYVWDMPYSGRNWLTKALTDRWQWSSIATLETGTPDTVFDGFDVNGDGRTNDRPNIGNKSVPLDTNGIDGVQLGLTATPGTFFGLTQDCLGNTSLCFPGPASSFHFLIPAGGNGTVGRNSLYGPGQVFWDTSIERRFPITERQSLMFRAEFFNVLNHGNLYTPTYDLLSPNFNDPAAFINSGSSAGDASGGRSIKFWLRYEF